MNPGKHLFFGILFSLFIYLIFPHIGVLECLVIILSTVLIDVDHCIYHYFRDKQWNPWKLYKGLIKKKKVFRALPLEERNNYYSGFFIFHGIEPLIILLLLGYIFNTIFLYVFVGFALHFLLDLIDNVFNWKRIDKVFLIYDHFKFKKLKCIENLFD